MPLYWMPIIIGGVILLGVRAAVWCCDPFNVQAATLWMDRGERERRHQQELRDIDVWIEQLWRDR